jgi:hypothetical protein
MQLRRTFTALLVTAPLLVVLGGTASAEPYLPPGAPIPPTGIITIAGDAAPVARATAPRRLKAGAARPAATRLVGRR